MAAWLRHAVSQQKRRLTDSEFDLDLSYIVSDPQHGNVIAMGVPVSGTAALWRNRRSEVQRFLDMRHGAGGYRVYNLCSEAEYQHPRGRFGGNIAYFPCDDHQVPPLWMMREFCQDAAGYMAGGEGRTIAVHCKAGRGRTGLMVCAYLLSAGTCATSDEAVALFNSKRTVDGQGLTVPSQLRFLRDYERMLRGELPAGASRPLILRRLTLRGPPATKLSRCRICMSMRHGHETAAEEVLTITAGTTLLSDAPGLVPQWAAVVADGELSAGSQANPPSPQFGGDILIEVFGSTSRSKPAFYCWLNTAAIPEDLVVDLDSTQLDKVDKSFRAGLRLTLTFLPADAS